MHAVLHLHPARTKQIEAVFQVMPGQRCDLSGVRP
jgi:hypothetical protein